MDVAVSAEPWQAGADGLESEATVIGKNRISSFASGSCLRVTRRWGSLFAASEQVELLSSCSW